VIGCFQGAQFVQPRHCNVFVGAIEQQTPFNLAAALLVHHAMLGSEHMNAMAAQLQHLSQALHSEIVSAGMMRRIKIGEHQDFHNRREQGTCAPKVGKDRIPSVCTKRQALRVAELSCGEDWKIRRRQRGAGTWNTIMDMALISAANRAKKRLGFNNALHLIAAAYWLELGEMEEARREFKKIRSRDPDVLLLKELIDARIDRAKDRAAEDVIVLAD